MHVKYVAALLQHSFTEAAIRAVDKLIMEQQELFLSIEEYEELWKPKNHYAQHLPLDTIRFGPPRGYWCMRFEAMYQTLKSYAQGSNYKQLHFRIAQFWKLN